MFKKKLGLLFIIIFIIIGSLICFKEIAKANGIVCETILDSSWGFSAASPYKREAPAKDIYIFEQKEEWEKFIDKHFSDSELPYIDFKKDKVVVVHTKFPQPTKGPVYNIQKIEVKGNALVVYIKQRGGSIVEPLYKNLWFSHIIICKIDGTSLPGNLIPYLKIEH